MDSYIKTPLALATALLLTCVWGASGAFADEEARSEKVKFQDLNVDTQEIGRAHV